jgi:hypothetical protein
MPLLSAAMPCHFRPRPRCATAILDHDMPLTSLSMLPIAIAFSPCYPLTFPYRTATYIGQSTSSSAAWNPPEHHRRVIMSPAIAPYPPSPFIASSHQARKLCGRYPGDRQNQANHPLPMAQPGHLPADRRSIYCQRVPQLWCRLGWNTFIVQLHVEAVLIHGKDMGQSSK